MINLPSPPHKPLEWIGPALEELLALPAPVIRSIGYALRFAQAGVLPDHAKPLKGFGGAGVVEVIEYSEGNAFRAVYTVKFTNVIYVLHCFQKKSKSGIATPKFTMDLIRRRLRDAESMHMFRSKLP